MYNDIRKNENKGFSLVELIVVIAIMAVLTAVLVPSLLSYVERSRAQKDDSAMGEVTNAVAIAMANQDVYDEVLFYTCYGNVACYIDSAAEDGAKIVTKKAANSSFNDQYYFGDEERVLDEQLFVAAGNMRGVTLTFEPEDAGKNLRKYDIADAIVNRFLKTGETEIATGRVNEKDKALGCVSANDKAVEGEKLGESAMPALHSAIKATVGESIVLDSQTYHNSDFTIFIRMGTQGVDAASSSGISVYGQWNGTNLIPGAVTGTPTT
jgi:prepilin-type N-terminal cleavage/methylation domain-containing protein